jgi:hypothetical protein
MSVIWHPPHPARVTAIACHLQVCPHMVCGPHAAKLKEMRSGNWAYIGKMPPQARRVAATKAGVSPTLPPDAPAASSTTLPPLRKSMPIPTPTATEDTVAVKIEEQPAPMFSFLKKRLPVPATSSPATHASEVCHIQNLYMY